MWSHVILEHSVYVHMYMYIYKGINEGLMDVTGTVWQ